MLQFRFQYCSEFFNTTVMISILQWLCQYHCSDFNTANVVSIQHLVMSIHHLLVSIQHWSVQYFIGEFNTAPIRRNVLGSIEPQYYPILLGATCRWSCSWSRCKNPEHGMLQHRSLPSNLTSDIMLPRNRSYSGRKSKFHLWYRKIKCNHRSLCGWFLSISTSPKAFCLWYRSPANKVSIIQLFLKIYGINHFLLWKPLFTKTDKFCHRFSNFLIFVVAWSFIFSFRYMSLFIIHLCYCLV